MNTREFTPVVVRLRGVAELGAPELRALATELSGWTAEEAVRVRCGRGEPEVAVLTRRLLQIDDEAYAAALLNNAREAAAVLLRAAERLEREGSALILSCIEDAEVCDKIIDDVAKVMETWQIGVVYDEEGVGQ